MLDHFQFNTHSEIYSRRFASIYRSLRTIYDPSDALAQEPDIEEKVLRNARLAHALNFRWAQVAGRKWSVAPAEEGEPEEAVLAKIVLQGMGKIRRFTNARKMLARADFSGARFAEVRKEVIWAPFGDGKMRRWVVPVMLKDIPKERFRWQRTEGTKTSVHLEVFDLQNDAWTKVPKSAPLIRHVYDDSEETLGYGRGLREALYFCWYAISHIHRERIDAVERFGQGRLVLKLAGEKDASIGSSNATIRDRALATLAKMKSRHEFVIGQGDELVQLDGSMTGHEMMSALTKEIEDSAVQLILGSVLPTGGGADVGSNARAQVEQESTDVLIQTCGDMLEESVSDGIAGPFLTDNYANLREMGLDGVPAPKFTILRGGHGDPLQNAQRIQIAMSTGLKVKRSEAYDLVELTEPGEDDDVLEPPQQPGMPPGGGMPGAPGEDPNAPPGGDPNDPQAGGDEQQQGDPEGGGDSQPLPGADDEIPEPDAVALAEWREEDHPRGQPGNAGEFGPGGGKTTKGKARSSHTGATTSAHASPGPALDAAWYYKQPRDVQIAVQVYTGDAENTVAPAMNRALIAGRGEADPETGASASLMLARALRVNAAAEAHPAWPEPHVLYRGIGRSGDFVTRARASIGKTLRLPGMQSTSEDRTKALEFAKNGGALLAITSRNGLPIQNLSVHVDEREVVLGHDWKYRVTKVDDGKTPVIHMEVVEPHGGSHALAEWDESKHPRGQPGNAGEFGPGGSSATAEAEQPKAKPKKAQPGSQLDPKHLERLKAIGDGRLPQEGASNIRLLLDRPDPDAGPLAVWTDPNGRTQYAYSAKFHEQNAAKKWKAVEGLEPLFEQIHSRAMKAVQAGEHGTAEHRAATAAALIIDTGMRPGSAHSADREHYGATTLQGRHVKVEGGKAVFDFVGKEGVHNHWETSEPVLVDAIGRYKAAAGDQGSLFGTSDDAVRAATPGGARLKDFRTIHGTRAARKALAAFQGPPPPLTGDPKKDARAIKKALLTASRSVATTLNNTPAIARGSYIHPAVFNEWLERVGAGHLRKAAGVDAMAEWLDDHGEHRQQRLDVSSAS